jgi:hypothetical protein
VTRGIALSVAAIAFAIVATANSGGYRFGVSDQAYYVPAITRLMDAALFPRDSALLDVQSRFLGSVHLFASVARVTGVGLPALFLLAYAATMAGLFASAVALARRLGFSWWATAAFVTLMTLRHRIAKTGANSLEGYMHPRMLAFACGVAACAAVATGRARWAILWVVVAGVMHPTTCAFFALMLGSGAAFAHPGWRRPLTIALVVGTIAGAWLVIAGPLVGRLTIMDADWVAVLADKDYVFPSQWPAYAWFINLAYPVVIALLYRKRRHAGLASPHELVIVAGVLALVAGFLVSVPLSAAHLALAVQLQVNRIFWLADLVAAAYVAWWLIDVWSPRRMRVGIVVVLVVIAMGRGAYVLRVESNRQIAQITLPDTPWVDALSWLRSQPVSWFVLADPGHAWKYGVSVRVGASRDTLLESGKDSSMAMYDRDVAMRVRERTLALDGFDTMDAAAVRALAARFHVDVLVESRAHHLDLPQLYGNADFVVYDLR